MSSTGIFITFEGGEGSGKSTQLKLLAGSMRVAGRPVRVLREPGGTRVGEAIRAILLDCDHEGLDARAELLLYEASRAQLVAEVIAPALEAGEIVLCDRFTDSTTAYQGYGRGLSLDEVETLNRAATGGLEPCRTLVFDLEPEVGLTRATRGGADRLETEDSAFHERVREGFLALANTHRDRIRVIDATGSVEDVAVLVAHALGDLLGDIGSGPSS